MTGDVMGKLMGRSGHNMAEAFSYSSGLLSLSKKKQGGSLGDLAQTVGQSEAPLKVGKGSNPCQVFMTIWVSIGEICPHLFS